MQIFLPPKEAQGKVRQSQGRAEANNFAFSRLGSIGTPLDHLSVKYNEHLSGTQIRLEGLMAQNELDKNT